MRLYTRLYSDLKTNLVKPAIIEASWLLGSWLASLGVVGTLVGEYSGTLDLQMHNTYFVLPVAVLATLLFLVVAPAVTGIRVISNHYRNGAANLVFGLLSGAWLVGLLAVFIAWSLK